MKWRRDQRIRKVKTKNNTQAEDQRENRDRKAGTVIKAIILSEP